MASTSPNLGLTIPDVNDEITDFTEGIAASMAILDTIYPVGIILEFTNQADPNVLWPQTTWSKLEGRFLVGAGSTYPLGSTGGSATHKHSKNDGGSLSNVANSSGSYVVSTTNNVASASSVPPYRAVNMWERTA